MMRRRTAAAVVGVSIVAGMAAGVVVHAMTSDAPPRAAARTGSTTAPLPATKEVEVKDAVLVHNRDGGATLSATLVNRTDAPIKVSSAIGGMRNDYDAPVMLVFGTRTGTSLAPGDSVRIGGVGDNVRLRFTQRVQIGSTLPVTISFQVADAGHGENPPRVTVTAPVVARTAEYVDVANNGPNDAISVEDARIVVVPGQEKAYVTGDVMSTITDMAEQLPTATDERGQPVEYRHQTATGGPYGIFASAGDRIRLAIPPYVETEPQGDADYFLASDVKVGKKIIVTMRFPSGDVVTKFRVVQGNPDGTV
jgi:hypothetical protein